MVLVQSGSVKVAIHRVHAPHNLALLLHTRFIVQAPFRPCLREIHVYLNGGRKRVVRFVVQRQTAQEHSLQCKEFGPLWLLKVAEVGVIDDIQSGGQVGVVLKVAFRLFSQFQKRVMYLDVGEGVDFVEGIDAHVNELMLSSNVCKSAHSYQKYKDGSFTD